MARKRSSRRMAGGTDDGGRKLAQNRLLVSCINAQWSEQSWSGIGSIVCRYVVQKQGSGCTRKWRFVLFQLLDSVSLLRVLPLSNDERNPSVLATRVVSYANVPESIPVSDYDGLNDSFESFKLVIGFHYLVSKVCD